MKGTVCVGLKTSFGSADAMGRKAAEDVGERNKNGLIKSKLPEEWPARQRVKFQYIG